MFGRATIRLGIGPHSNCFSFCPIFLFFVSGCCLPSAFQRTLNAGGIPVKLIAANSCRRWLGLCRYAEFGRYSAYRIPPSILYIPGHCPICPVTDGIHDVLCKCVCKKWICRHLIHQNPEVDRRRQITPYINKTHNTTA